MATLLEQTRPRAAREYFDKTVFSSLAAHRAAKAQSSTVYVGGLSEFTMEQQLHALFSMCGTVQRVVMGLHRVDRKPCGFCFVEFEKRHAALDAEQMISGLEVDGKRIKVEIDPGFIEGRQFGRARSGGQVQDERRQQAFGFGGAAPIAPAGRTNRRGGRNRNRDARGPRSRGRDLDRPADGPSRRPSTVQAPPPAASGAARASTGPPPAPKRPRAASKDSADSADEEELQRRRDRRRRRRRRNDSDSDSSDSD